MPKQVAFGASLQCSFGAAPSTLTAIAKGPPTTAPSPPLQNATIMDFAPMANVMPFGMCSAPTNPAVISATAAALGVFTPMPCVPVPVGPWKPGAIKVKINNFPALTDTSLLNCSWLGIIKINVPGQVITDSS